MKSQKLILQQLDSKIKHFSGLERVAAPSSGWIKAIRLALNMSLAQLGHKLHITKQSVRGIELREKEGAITIQTLREVAHALDMDLVYGFVPRDGSLDALVSRRAKAVATKVVLRTSQTMRLEGQENSQERLEKAVEEKAAELKNKMPKILWD